MNTRLLVPSLLLTCAVLLAANPKPTAELGDPAPALQIAEWVKGQPVDLAAGKGKQVFVVEFWATWCPPCRASIPHLTELQKKFKAKEVVFIGVSDEEVGKVKPFVADMGAKMDYVVAVDKDRRTSAAYMQAYGANGIPHAFVVNKEGRIVWQGHPMKNLEKTLDQLLEGKYDLAVAKKQSRGKALYEEFCELAARGKEDPRADEIAKELAALTQEVSGIIPGDKFDPAATRKRVRFGNLLNEYRRAAYTGGDPAKLDELTKQVEAQAPDDFNFTQFRSSLRVELLFRDYYRLATGAGDNAKMADLGKQMLEVDCKNPMLLNEISWRLLTDAKVKSRDLPFVEKLARAAYDACQGKEASVVDTYARALADNGKHQDAVKYQKQAVELCQDPDQRKELETTLKGYQQKAGAK